MIVEPMSEVLRGWALWVVAACVLLAALAPAPSSHAQAAALGSEGLRGGRYVGSALPAEGAVRAVGAFGVAHTEDVLKAHDRHERMLAELGAAFIARPWMQLAARLEGRYDLHRSEVHGKDHGLAGSTDILTRHAFQLSPDFALAAQLRARFPAASTAKRGLSATTTELSALASHTLFGDGEISGTLGYRFDRSAHALEDARSVSAADRLAASTSRFDALLIGALLAAPVGPTTLIGEWSWDVNVGSRAPDPFHSPMRLRAAVQSKVGDYLVPGFEIGVNLTGRPALGEGARIEPRVWALLSLGVVFDRRSRTPEPDAKALPAPAQTQEEGRLGELLVQVSDPEKSPLAGAHVTIRSEHGTQRATTDASGRAGLRVVRGEPLELTIEAEGFHSASQTLSLDEPELVLALSLERSLPEGEIKGRVRSLRGGPLKAKIEILETGRVVETESDGTFRIDVPPGDYRVRITAEGHEPQERSAQVERLGVTILVVDLRRSRK